MRPRPTTWGEVTVDTYLQGDRDEVWKVVDERDGWVLLQNRAGRQAPMQRPAPTRHVSVLEPTMEEAIAVAAQYLGAIVIPDREVNGGPMLSRFPGGQADH